MASSRQSPIVLQLTTALPGIRIPKSNRPSMIVDTKYVVIRITTWMSSQDITGPSVPIAIDCSLHHLRKGSIPVYLHSGIREKIHTAWEGRGAEWCKMHSLRWYPFPDAFSGELTVIFWVLAHAYTDARKGIIFPPNTHHIYKCMKSPKNRNDVTGLQPFAYAWLTGSSVGSWLYLLFWSHTRDQPNERKHDWLRHRWDLSRNHDFTRSSIQIERRHLHSRRVQRRLDALFLRGIAQPRTSIETKRDRSPEYTRKRVPTIWRSPHPKTCNSYPPRC